MSTMTIGEFKAFIEGMNVGPAPSPYQWQRIVEKIDLLAPTPLLDLGPVYPGPFISNTGDLPPTFPYTTC